jgi:hypothetical protein
VSRSRRSTATLAPAAGLTPRHEHSSDRPRLGYHRESRRRHADHELCRRLAGASPGGAARPRQRSDRVLDDRRSGKEHEIEAEDDVGPVFIDIDDKAYLSITARAEVPRDPAKAADIWKATDTAWWSGPDDPNVCVLRVRPLIAELWDGPASRAVAAFEFAKARLTGQAPNLGENRKVTVTMS